MRHRTLLLPLLVAAPAQAAAKSHRYPGRSKGWRVRFMVLPCNADQADLRRRRKPPRTASPASIALSGSGTVTAVIVR